jgi:hypothetical protein
MKENLAAMCNRMRRILVALAVALPLIVVVPDSHGQVTMIGSEFLLCTADQNTSTAWARIFPPTVVWGTTLWWIAAVHHWDAYNNYMGYNWTNWLYHNPPQSVYVPGPGWIDPYTGLGEFVTAAYSLGTVAIETFLWDEGTYQWIVYGAVGPSCRLDNTFGG